MRWSTLIEHAQHYALANGWEPDAVEAMVENVLDNGGEVDNFWIADLVDWPFSGDRCLLAWSEHVVNEHMLRDIVQYGYTRNESNGDLCMQLGRWLAQRPHLVVSASEPIVRLVQYVHTLDSMAQYTFDAFQQKHHSSHVMLCEDIDLRKSRAYQPPFKRELSKVLTHPKERTWSEHAFRCFVLGFAWEWYDQGEPQLFQRASAVLNGMGQWTTPAQLELCMQKPTWLNQAFERAQECSALGFFDIERQNSDFGLERFYPQKLDAQQRREQFKRVTAEAARTPQCAGAIYKLTLAAAFHEHFRGSSSALAFERLEIATPLLKVMELHEQQDLFSTMVRHIQGKLRIDERNHYYLKDPWSSFAEKLEIALSHVHNRDHEDSTALGALVEWLSHWEHPFQKDLQMYAAIGSDCHTVGVWLAEVVESAANPVVHDVDTLVLHDLFDMPADEVGSHGVFGQDTLTVKSGGSDKPPKDGKTIDVPAPDIWNMDGLF